MEILNADEIPKEGVRQFYINTTHRVMGSKDPIRLALHATYEYTNDFEGNEMTREEIEEEIDEQVDDYVDIYR